MTVTKERIRFLLVHNKTIRSNIWKARQITIEMESDADVINALLTPAMDYGRDKVQTGGDPTCLSMSTVRTERFKQRRDVRMRNAIIDAQEAEIEKLDCAVFSLPPASQQIIILRFYDCLTKRQIEEQAFYSRDSVRRITRKALGEIVELFNGFGIGSTESPYNDLATEGEDDDMVAKEYGKFIPTCDICGEELTEEDTFEEAVSAIKKAGWQIKKEDGAFVSFCPSCR